MACLRSTPVRHIEFSLTVGQHWSMSEETTVLQPDAAAAVSYPEPGDQGFPGPTRPARILTWFFFVVMAGLLPLIKPFSDAVTPEHWSWTKMLGTGELFIVSAVLAGTALGDSYLYQGRRTGWSTLAFGGSFATLLANLFMYWVAHKVESPAPSDPVMWESLLLFLLAVFTSGSSFAMASEK
jgi:hypothetical protein